MGKDWVLKRRKPIRRKQVTPLLTRLADELGWEVDLSSAFIETSEYGPWKLLLVDKEPWVIQINEEEYGNEVFLTLRGILEISPNTRWAAVDHGAIPFLMNGADCMVAGICDADSDIKEGDLIWIRDATHGKPLAIGRALKCGADLVSESKGKGVKTIHWIGDPLWEMEV